MAGLLYELAARRPCTQYLRSLMAVLKELPGTQHAVTSSSPTPDNRDDFLPVSLSNREIDILLLLEDRFTNKEIAERLHISTETVKSHTINIYRKLEVNKRRQAVSVARKRGLLPLK